jgi:preprotein translocase subunit SecE
MNWKEFLKPDWRKIVLTIILFTIVTGLKWYLFDTCLGCYNTYFGVPLAFYEKIVWPRENEMTNFLIFNLIVDIIFWYLLSCLIVWIYDKFRKKK